MTLTVRLDPTLEAALERHCIHTGTSKSHVVQESLSAYLMGSTSAMSTALTTDHDAALPSPAFQAFAEVGLVGGVALPVSSADAPGSGLNDNNLPGTKGANKAAVRAQVAARALARQKAP